MTEDQIKNAIEQVKVHCDLLMHDYEMVSLRGALNTLGFADVEVEEVICTVAERGFSYCVDYTIAHNGKRPNQDVCYWGPDQLKSRLDCVW